MNRALRSHGLRFGAVAFALAGVLAACTAGDLNPQPLPPGPPPNDFGTGGSQEVDAGALPPPAPYLDSGVLANPTIGDAAADVDGAMPDAGTDAAPAADAGDAGPDGSM